MPSCPECDSFQLYQAADGLAVSHMGIVFLPGGAKFWLPYGKAQIKYITISFSDRHDGNPGMANKPSVWLVLKTGSV